MKPVLSGRRLLVTVAAASVLAAGGAATALAAQDGGRDEPPNAKVTADQAAAAVLKAAPGRIGELELDSEAGKAAWEADVLGDDGTWRAVRIDAADGKVLANAAVRPGSGSEGENDDESDDQDATPAAETKALQGAKLTAAQAAAAALKTVPGTVTSVEFDQAAGGTWAWDVDVTGQDGKERELTLDPATGKVVANVADGAAEDGPDDD